jgi:hypothetical protein
VEVNRKPVASNIRNRKYPEAIEVFLIYRQNKRGRTDLT